MAYETLTKDSVSVVCPMGVFSKSFGEPEWEAFMTFDAEQRAALGASVLDTQYPDWHNSAAPNLDMQFDDTCVLAQIYGHYREGEIRLQLGGSDQMIAHGFFIRETPFPIEDDRRYRLLTVAWLDEIQKRLDLEKSRSTEENHLVPKERVPELV